MSSKDLIISLPNPNLRIKSKKVGVVTDDLKKLINDMESATLDWETSRKHELGVALAAIQVNAPLKVVIIRNDFENKQDKTFKVFLNPEIVKFEGEIEADFEGCLSVTDIYGKVPRYTKIRVRALNEQGQQVRIKAEGFLARVLQHEIDHTNGIVFVDHIKDHPDAFYKLDGDGKLIQLDYGKVQKNIFLR